jgi:hypothetical protein
MISAHKHIEDFRNGYNDFVHDMEIKGMSKRTTNMNELDSSYIVKKGIRKNDTDYIVDVMCPIGQFIATTGIYEDPNPHTLSIDILDENGSHIPDDTRIRILKFSYQSERVIKLAELLYLTVKSDKKDVDPHSCFLFNNQRTGDQLFRFSCGFKLNQFDHFKIQIIDSPVNIPKENIDLKVGIDIWHKKKIEDMNVLRLEDNQYVKELDDMKKQDAERVAIELNALGISYKFEAIEFCEDQYLGCEGRCKNTDDCWIVKVDE